MTAGRTQKAITMVLLACGVLGLFGLAASHVQAQEEVDCDGLSYNERIVVTCAPGTYVPDNPVEGSDDDDSDDASDDESSDDESSPGDDSDDEGASSEDDADDPEDQAARDAADAVDGEQSSIEVLSDSAPSNVPLAATVIATFGIGTALLIAARRHRAAPLLD